MNTFFVYEFMTGGGLLSTATDLLQSPLLSEGSAMLAALAADFAALPGSEVVVLRDHRLPELRIAGCNVEAVKRQSQHDACFRHWSAECQWTLIVAPETAGELSRCCQTAMDAGGRLLGPPVEVVKLCTDKQATAEWLMSRGVQCPSGQRLDRAEELAVRKFDYPIVIKPIDGCGSEGVRLIRGWHELLLTEDRFPVRVERYQAGLPASVAVLCGPGVLYPLPACRQRLSNDGRFRYLGGELLLNRNLAQRAESLALSATRTLHSPLGYVGVDLVLGEDERGRDDYVIEINPRVTTSYVGLRASCHENLAGAMIEAANGRMPELTFDRSPLLFDADGSVHRGSPAEAAS